MAHRWREWKFDETVSRKVGVVDGVVGEASRFLWIKYLEIDIPSLKKIYSLRDPLCTFHAQKFKSIESFVKTEIDTGPQRLNLTRLQSELYFNSIVVVCNFQDISWNNFPMSGCRTVKG